MKRVQRLRDRAKRLRAMNDPEAEKIAADLEVAARWLQKRAPH